MRAITRSTPKISRAVRATMMLELSPLVTAASAPASSMPASRRRSRSKPDAVDGAAREALGQPPERLGLLVDDGDGVAAVLQDAGQAGTDPATSDDDDVQRSLLRPPVERSGTADPTTGPLRGEQPGAGSWRWAQEVADLGEQQGLVARGRRVLDRLLAGGPAGGEGLHRLHDQEEHHRGDRHEADGGVDHDAVAEDCCR